MATGALPLPRHSFRECVRVCGSDPHRRDKPNFVLRGVDFVKLNAIAILLLGALAVSSSPDRVTRATHPVSEPVRAPPAEQHRRAAVLEFVPVLNFDEFLLAAEENAPVSPAARQAAEALSARFADPPSKSDTDFLHAVVQGEPVAAASLVGSEIMEGTSRLEQAGGLAIDLSRVAALPAAQAAILEHKGSENSGHQEEADTTKGIGSAQRPHPVVRFPARELGPRMLARPRWSKLQRWRPSPLRSADPNPVNASAETNDWQVGIPGQSMEPLISQCAKVPRNCTGVLFCGC